MGRFLEAEELRAVAAKLEELARGMLQACEAFKRGDELSVEAYADFIDDRALFIHGMMEGAFIRKARKT